MTHTPGRITLTATCLTWLLDQPGPLALDTLGRTVLASAPELPSRIRSADGGPWHHTIPAADLPALHAWLHRLDPAVPVRIGTANLADGTGLLLTLRAGAQAIRLHQPTTTATEARCARCQQHRTVHPASPDWGHAPSPLCTTCWTRYADARAADDYVDWPDVLRNADDDELTRALTTEETTR